MTVIRTLNALRKSKDGLNPVAFGWMMLLAIGWPVLVVAVAVSLVSILMIASGKDPTELAVASVTATVNALSVPVPAMLGGWIMYTYMYLLVGVFLAAAVGARYATPLIWTSPCHAVPRLRDRITTAWRSIPILRRCFIPFSTDTYPSTISVQRAFQVYRASGWRASEHPQIK